MPPNHPQANSGLSSACLQLALQSNRLVMLLRRCPWTKDGLYEEAQEKNGNAIITVALVFLALFGKKIRLNNL